MSPQSGMRFFSKTDCCHSSVCSGNAQAEGIAGLRACAAVINCENPDRPFDEAALFRKQWDQLSSEFTAPQMSIIQKCCGVDALIQILHEKFVEHVRDEWKPTTVKRLREQKDAAKAALDALGIPAEDIAVPAVMSLLQQKVLMLPATSYV